MLDKNLNPLEKHILNKLNLEPNMQVLLITHHESYLGEAIVDKHPQALVDVVNTHKLFSQWMANKLSGYSAIEEKSERHVSIDNTEHFNLIRKEIEDVQKLLQK